MISNGNRKDCKTSVQMQPWLLKDLLSVPVFHLSPFFLQVNLHYAFKFTLVPCVGFIHYIFFHLLQWNNQWWYFLSLDSVHGLGVDTLLRVGICFGTQVYAVGGPLLLMLSDANKHAASLLGQSKMCPAIRAKQSADNGKRCSLNKCIFQAGLIWMGCRKQAKPSTNR